MVEESADVYREVTKPYVEREELGDRIKYFFPNLKKEQRKKLVLHF